MQYNIDSCNYTNTSGNKDLTEGEVKIKKEIESKDLIPLENVIKNEQIEMIQTNNDYENFKLKNEEVDLKFECNDGDLSTHECEKVDFSKEMSSDKSYINSVKEEKEHKVNDPEINVLRKRDLLKHKIKHSITDGIPTFKCHQCSFETYHKGSLFNHVKIHQNIKDFKCTLCSKAFGRKCALDNHLLKIHKCRNVRKKLYNCDQCGYECLSKSNLLKHKIKHGITNGIPILKCYQCTYQTYRKEDLIKHVKIHQNINKFKCKYCSKQIYQKSNLYRHLLRIHNCGDVRQRQNLYNCDQCGYECLKKSDLLRHKIKHGVTDGIPIFKCYDCTFETYRREDLVKHVKIHQNINNFKCTYCSKEFTQKYHLKNHLFRIHKFRDSTKILHNCDQCSYEAIEKRELLLHKLKHNDTSGLQILKCHKCTFETYYRSNLTKHIKRHENMKEFKCRNVGKKPQKIYNCNQCSFEYLEKKELLRHKIKHCITDGIPIFKCYNCSFETYRKSSLYKHVKIHRNSRSAQ